MMTSFRIHGIFKLVHETGTGVTTWNFKKEKVWQRCTHLVGLWCVIFVCHLSNRAENRLLAVDFRYSNYIKLTKKLFIIIELLNLREKEPRSKRMNHDNSSPALTEQQLPKDDDGGPHQKSSDVAANSSALMEKWGCTLDEL